MLRFSENRRSSGLSVTTNPRTAMSTHGLVEATQSEAEGGTVTGRYMSPLRTAQAFLTYSGAALTKTDDTNITLTLGGTPATAVLKATSITVGWTGTLAASRGGTGLSSLGSGVATWLGTPSSANLAAAMTDKTGTGVLVFGTSPTFTTQITTPSVIGGTASSSTLSLGSTSGTGTTDWIRLKTGAQVESLSVETMPGSNTLTLASGSLPGLTAIRAGTTLAGTGIFTTPGIGPAPSSGLLFVVGDYADSSAGNISNIYSVAYNSGDRYTAGGTFIGVARNGAVSAQIWGGQCSAIFQGSGAGIGQGINIECDWSTGVGTYIGATIKLGDSAGGVTVNAGNCYINMLADTGKTPVTGIRFQSTAFTSTNTQSILNVEGGSAVNGIDLSSMTFTGSPYKSPGFAISLAGIPTFMSTTGIPAGGTAGSGLKVSSTSNFGVFFGSGAPSLAAAKGSLYLRSDGSGVNDRMYVNTNGSTTWTAVVTAA